LSVIKRSRLNLSIKNLDLSCGWFTSVVRAITLAQYELAEYSSKFP